MIWRPQYAFSTPAGFSEDQFHYSFDSTNVPILGTAIAAGGQVDNITLQLQNDAEFVLRSLKIQSGHSVNGLYAVLRDPYGNYLSASPLPLGNYLTPSGGGICGNLEVPFEAEIIAPIGGFFQLFLYNASTAPITPPALTLYGVNRRPCLPERGRMIA